jgi:hypothetical protein
MKKYIFLVILFVGIQAAAWGQKKVVYTISAEAHALMCPHLSPKLMALLTKKGAEGIYKDDQLLLHFTTSKEAELSDAYILQLVDQIGYEARHFKIQRTEE